MKTLSAATVIAMTLGVGSALASDLPSTKGPPAYAPPPAFTWTGFYNGLNIGGGWLDHGNGGGFVLVPAPGAIVFLPTGSDTNGGGVVGGYQSGYNYQFSPLFVAGVEDDFQGASIGSGDGGFGLGRHVEWFGTLRGRIGVTPTGVMPFNSPLLIYGTGGFAYGRVQQDGFFFQHSDIKTGWTAGGGVEFAFLANWSAKVEYLFTDLASDDNGLVFLGGHQQTRFHTIRAGVNYHHNLFEYLFANLFAPAPAVAKY